MVASFMQPSSMSEATMQYVLVRTVP